MPVRFANRPLPRGFGSRGRSHIITYLVLCIVHYGTRLPMSEKMNRYQWPNFDESGLRRFANASLSSFASSDA